MYTDENLVLYFSGGFAGLYSQFGAYQRWCRTTSTRAQFHEKTLEMAGLLDDPDCPRAGRHRELEKAEIKKSEKAVQRVITAVRNFTNPFTIPDKDRLYSLASGSPTSKDVERDVLEADAVGKAAKADFITRLQSGHQGSFFDPIKRKKLKTMEACNKKIKLTSSQGKVIQYQEQSNVAFLLLVKSQCLDEPIDLDELMKYSLMPVPPSIGTSDGFFAKTNKATILHYLMEEFNQDELPYPKDALFIQDGMALLHVLSNLPPTCGEICLQILDQMIAKKHFLFSTDSYFPGSIKAQERLRRGKYPIYFQNPTKEQGLVANSILWPSSREACPFGISTFTSLVNLCNYEYAFLLAANVRVLALMGSNLYRLKDKAESNVHILFSNKCKKFERYLEIIENIRKIKDKKQCSKGGGNVTPMSVIVYSVPGDKDL
ncbi:uncharacterized protein [Palaemon carinicauda]|uniref:uncharacterized protein n=1 Tax=Palaemon carinicauda TaxID=392227 RepID=UPI0035B5CFA1